MRIELEQTKRNRNAGIVVALGLTIAMARPAWPAPRKPTPKPTATPTQAPATTPTPTRSPTPPATPTPAGLAVQISFPAAGAQIDGDRVTVTGSFQGPSHTAIVVNGVLAYASTGRFVANDVLLVAGSNAVIAEARTSSGMSAETLITVSATGTTPALTVVAEPTSGRVPLSVHFVPTWRGSEAARSMKIDFDGDGTIDLQPSSPLAPVDRGFGTAGLYVATFTVQDQRKRSHTARVGILVTPDQVDALFLSIWDGMNDELLAGNIEGALSYLTPEAREIYAEVFDGLIADMPAIVPSYSRPVRVTEAPGSLEYAVTRVIDGEKRMFFVSAVLDADGAWRIDSF